MIKNYGLIPKPIEEEDWLFGSSGLGTEVRRVDTNWFDYLPLEEKQRRADEDKMACVSFSALNTLEIEFNYQIREKLINVDDLQWLDDHGYLDKNGEVDFNDAFISTLSETTRQGNYPKKVAQTIHKYGLVPESIRPYRKAMTWDEFYSKSWINNDVINLGKEFLKRFPINYEFVNGGKSQFDQVRKYNPLQVFLYAWNGKSNGVYVRVNHTPNHGVANHNTNQIFDSYDPHIKTLANNYNYLGYAIRYLISFKKKEGEKYMLQRKKNANEVFLTLGDERVWIKTKEDFELLKSSQPIQNIEWENIKEVDEFTLPYNGRIIGKPDFTVSDFLKMLLGKIGIGK
jgi:hypothetical protein